MELRPRRRARVLPPPSRVTAEDSAQPPQSSRPRGSPPPALMDDAIGEILLRLPPSDPACLVRASLVCKPWLRLLSDRDFLRRYRAFHQTPPMLGFFKQYLGCSTVRGFVPTTQASLPVPHMAPAGYTLDCRHGRVLLQPSKSKSSRLVVWDPITGEQQSFSSPVHPNNCFATAVLCASHGCDHLECCGGPFLVAIVGTDWHGHIGGTLGSVYSSRHCWGMGARQGNQA
ncbi:hypothetical protein BS78_K036100 [Paspalum vaginatum]|uniref:F-box domain-containing protein n=1 Tax=Paspalum vaginatum TaxID=158149 RepID=A0A9W7XCH5_9POAL|nr:hypothetical protein BS78_K036100 [Paspalum vaginatum]